MGWACPSRNRPATLATRRTRAAFLLGEPMAARMFTRTARAGRVVRDLVRDDAGLFAAGRAEHPHRAPDGPARRSRLTARCTNRHPSVSTPSTAAVTRMNDAAVPSPTAVRSSIPPPTVLTHTTSPTGNTATGARHA